MSQDALTLQERRDRSALVILVPEVVDLLSTIRAGATEDGASVPPHITLYNPFYAPSEMSPSIRERISAILAAVPAFGYELGRIERFGDAILYLAPEPAAPFRDLVGRLRADKFDVPPYWDNVDEVVPHVTVADARLTGDVAGLDRFAESIRPALPVACSAHEVVLIQRVRPSPAPWDITARFPLRG
jgi:2'-5' RNA ligase